MRAIEGLSYPRFNLIVGFRQVVVGNIKEIAPAKVMEGTTPTKKTPTIMLRFGKGRAKVAFFRVHFIARE